MDRYFLKQYAHANGDGKLDSGELLTQEQANISGMYLYYINSESTDFNGNQHKQQGSFIKTDGTIGNINDVWFASDEMDSIDITTVEIPADFAVSDCR